MLVPLLDLIATSFLLTWSDRWSLSLFWSMESNGCADLAARSFNRHLVRSFLTNAVVSLNSSVQTLSLYVSIIVPTSTLRQHRRYHSSVLLDEIILTFNHGDFCWMSFSSCRSSTPDLTSSLTHSTRFIIPPILNFSSFQRSKEAD
jgi:hypothetical protein